MAFEVRGRVSADTSQLRAALANARAQLMGLAKTGRMGAGGIGDALGAMGLPTGKTLGWLAFGLAVREATVDSEKFLNAAANFGSTPELMRAISNSAALAGVEFAALTGAMAKANIQIEKAKAGSEASIAALAALGLKVGDLKGPPAENFQKIANALRAAGGDGAKLAAMQQLMGRGAAELLPAMEGVADAHESLSMQLPLQAAMMRELDAAGDNLKGAWQGIVIAAGAVAGILAPIFNRMVAVIAAAGAFVGAIASGDGIRAGALEAVAVFEKIVNAPTDQQAKLDAAARQRARDKNLGVKGPAIDADEEGIARGARRGGLALAGVRDNGAAVGLRIGRDVGAVDLEVRRHALLMEKLTAGTHEAARETARHLAALARI